MAPAADTWQPDMKKILLSANPRDAVWLGWGAAKLNALKSFTKTAFTRYLTPEAGCWCA